MNVTTQLRDLGQSLWLDNITRQILDDGTLHRHIGDFAITRLTSHPTNDQAGIEEKSGASVRA
jgi:transaldolase